MTILDDALAVPDKGAAFTRARDLVGEIVIVRVDSDEVRETSKGPKQAPAGNVWTVDPDTGETTDHGEFIAWQVYLGRQLRNRGVGNWLAGRLIYPPDEGFQFVPVGDDEGPLVVKALHQLRGDAVGR